jgi:chromosome segregation ATPase
MKLSLYGTILIAALALICQGCGENRIEKSASQTQPAQQLVSDLQSTLAQARENLDREKERNFELMERVQVLLEKLKETESRIGGQQPTETARATDPGERKRIELMGAKALAEYRAEQFRRRLDQLNRDLDLKENELEAIRQNSSKKDLEVTELRRNIEELQAADKNRTEQLNAKLGQITRDLEERTEAATRFKKDLDEKTELLAALKNAVSDATKLKANAEAEIARLSGDLREALTQLEASQSQVAQYRQELMLVKSNLEKTQIDADRLHQEVGNWQNETDRSRNETEQMRQTADSFKKQAEQFWGEAERSRQESEQLRAEMERARQEIVLFRVEADRARQEANDLKVQVSELGGKLQTLEAKLQPPDDGRPSSIDLLLENPRTEGARGPTSNLY